MLRLLLLLGLLGTGAARGAAAEPADPVTLRLAGTPLHPRNSEGAFATLHSGRIIFCYSQFSNGASDFSPSRVAEIDSDDQGRTWSAPRILFAQAGDAQEMSVSLLRLASGKLALFSLIKHGTRECRPYERISLDEGAHWSDPRPLFSAPGYFVLNNDRVIQMASGRLVAPIAYHRTLPRDHPGDSDTDRRGIALWYYSDDEGATWTEAGTWWTIPVPSASGLQEPGVVELADGSLLSWARTDLGYQEEFRSDDGGVTWSAPQPTRLRSPVSPAAIKRLPGSATLLAVLNDHSGQFPFLSGPRRYAGRSPLVMEFSTDGGHTWSRQRLIEGDLLENYSYPSLHFAGDSLLLAYLAEGRAPQANSALVIRRIRLPWLRAPEDPAVIRSRAVLHEIYDHEESWVKIHAAEALVAGGEAIEVREKLVQLVPQVDSLTYRVGVWRVLAATSPTAAERAACVAAVENIYLDPTAPDRSQAIETLCKLRVVVSGPVLQEVRREAALKPGQLQPHSLQPLALWSLALAAEPGALARLCAVLRDPEAGLRVDGAYALRLLGTEDPAARRALVQAVAVEPPGTAARPYLLSAAFTLRADEGKLAQWRSSLEELVRTGSSDARFEACQGLRPAAALSDLARYEPLLTATAPDTRIGAAYTILYVHARQ